MIVTKYFIAGEKLFAFNAKCCSSSIVREIIRSYYPAIEKSITEAAYPEGKSDLTVQHHQWLPYRINPDRPVVQVVRDPVDRFRSAMWQTRLRDVDAVLDELRDERGDLVGDGVRLAANVHFLPQSRFSGDISFFPVTRVDEAAKSLGLSTPLPRLHQSTGKVDLTAEQAERVREWYAADVELWEQLK